MKFNSKKINEKYKVVELYKEEQEKKDKNEDNNVNVGSCDNSFKVNTWFCN
jgi:hypothetical protein